MLTPIIIFIGVLSSVASDAGYLVLIPLGAAAFKSVGRNPLAGMAAAFAGVAAGFGVNFLITPLDGVLTEITNDASALADPERSIDLAANLYFGIASTILVTIVLTFVSVRIVERSLGKHDPALESDDASLDADKGPEVSAEAEAKGLRYALSRPLAVVVVIALLTVFPDAPLRDPVTGDIIGDSPFMDSLIVIITMIFFAAGLAYGRGAGTIRTSDEVLASITKSWAGLASLLFLFLLIAQFIAYFNYSNMAQVAAVKLGDWLEEANIGAVWLLIGFVFVTMLVDLIMPAAIAKWAILAPIFIPLLPAARRGAADGARGLPRRRLAANVVTPLMAYFPLIVIFAQRYRRDAGIGTVVSMMLPYVIVLRWCWTLFFVVWYLRRHPARTGLACPSRLVGHPSGTASRATPTSRSVSDSTITFLVLAPWSSCSSGTACRSAIVADRRRALALGDRRPRPRAGARRLRRPDRDLHRLAVRRQRGARRGGRDGVGGAGAGRARRGEPHAADRPDDAAGRGAHGADQRQRRGRRARAGGGRDGRAARPLAVAAAAAAGVRRACRLAAGADRDAGQRDRLRRRGRRGRRALRLLRVRARRRAAPSPASIAIVVLFGERLLPSAAARDRARLQRPRAHARRAVRARRTPPTSC